MDELKKGEKVITDKYGHMQIVRSAPAVPKKTAAAASSAMKGSKPTVGTPKSQTKYFPRPKKAKPILKTPVNSKGKKANAAASPFYGRPKRS